MRRFQIFLGLCLFLWLGLGNPLFGDDDSENNGRGLQRRDSLTLIRGDMVEFDQEFRKKLVSKLGDIEEFVLMVCSVSDQTQWAAGIRRLEGDLFISYYDESLEHAFSKRISLDDAQTLYRQVLKLCENSKPTVTFDRAGFIEKHFVFFVASSWDQNLFSGQVLSGLAINPPNESSAGSVLDRVQKWTSGGSGGRGR